MVDFFLQLLCLALTAKRVINARYYCTIRIKKVHYKSTFYVIRHWDTKPLKYIKGLTSPPKGEKHWIFVSYTAKKKLLSLPVQSRSFPDNDF